MEFYKTRLGTTFFNLQLPALINNLSKLASELERSNNLKEQELKLMNKNRITENKKIKLQTKNIKNINE